ncbi:hypothetical protein ACOZ4I_08635 [Haloarcula salina]|uniref:hypothetical protein n=1 Tax=Haloarcula salina TaxID=1429914 RepID=UPI003C6FBF1A
MSVDKLRNDIQIQLVGIQITLVAGMILLGLPFPAHIQLFIVWPIVAIGTIMTIFGLIR